MEVVLCEVVQSLVEQGLLQDRYSILSRNCGVDCSSYCNPFSAPAGKVSPWWKNLLLWQPPEELEHSQKFQLIEDSII